METGKRLIKLLLLMAIGLVLTGPNPAFCQTETVSQDQAPGRIMAQQATKAKELWITADHSKHKALQQDFKSGPEVTKACLSCHSEAAAQFHKTIHWTWMDPSTEDNLKLGKGGLSINNF
jgi:hypothetical protein